MKYLIIYLIGFFISYYLIRKNVRNLEENKYDWFDVFIVFLLSLMSYLSILAYLFSKNKPPKWL
jgi:prolipoprotein diacylglyceryltransferase